MKTSQSHKKTLSLLLLVAAIFAFSPLTVMGQKSKGKNGKMTICHFPPGNPENVQSITIDESAWEAHKAHGDEIGRNCEKKKFKKISICHYPPGNPDNVQVISIDESAWEAHEAHGDARGSDCTPVEPEPTIDICHEGESMTIKESEWADHESHGDNVGECVVEPTIDICHEGESMTIKESEWADHESHGDNVGECVVEPTIDICHDGELITIKESEWADHESHDDSIGECPDEPETPTGTLTHSEVTVCEGTTGILPVSLTGEGPWTVVYTDGSKDYTLSNVNTEQYDIEVSEPGVYKLVTVYDANEVEGSTSGESKLTINEQPDVTVSGVGTYCEGESAELTFNLTGTGPWTINYTDGVQNYTQTANSNNYTLVTNATTEYKITSISDAICSHVFETEVIAKVEVVTLPSAEISGGGAICEGGKTTLDFELGGVGPWTVKYGNGINEFEFTTDKENFTEEVSEAGEFEIISVNNGHCTTGGVGVVSIKETPELDGTVKVAETHCEGEEITLEFVVKNGGDLDVIWQVANPTDGEFVNFSGNVIIFKPSKTASDEIVFEAHLSNQCESGVVVTGSTIIQKLNANFQIEPATDKFLTGVEYTFTAEDEYADDYEWQIGNDVLYGRSVNYTFTEANTAMTVNLKIQKDNCETDFIKSTPIVWNTGVHIPSVFSPDATLPDNRVVKVYASDVSDSNFLFEIYNRWGLKVYSTTSFSQANTEGWNGYNGGELQENGVYTYIIRYTLNNGDSEEKTGTITLVN